MGNNTTDNNKLDDTVKETLNNYEAQFDAGDWSRMEKMLDTAPKSGKINWSYGIAIIIGAVVIGGSYLIYKGISSSAPDTDTAIEIVIPAPENKTEQLKITPPPVVINNTPSATAPENKIPEIKTAPEKSSVAATEKNQQKERSFAEKAKKNQKKKTDTADTDFLKNQKVSVMGNEPVFGDMIDSSKGIIHETKEKESTKKAAKTKGTSNIGLSGLLNLNVDSIKKQQEQMKKDSVNN